MNERQDTGSMTVERQGRVMVLTMSDSDTRNALGLRMMAAGRDALDEAAHDPHIGAIVLTLRTREGVRKQNIGAQLARRREDVVAIRKVPTGEGV